FAELLGKRFTYEHELIRWQFAGEVRYGIVHLEMELFVDTDVAGVQALQRITRSRRSSLRAGRRLEVCLEIALGPRCSPRVEVRRCSARLVNPIDAHAALPARVCPKW